MLINFDMWNVMYTAEKCWIMITLVFCLQPERKKENFWKPALILNYNFGLSDVKLGPSRGLTWSPSWFPIIPLSSLTWPHNLLPSLTNSEHLWSTKFVTFDTRDCASVRALKRENNHYWNEQFRHLHYNLYQLNCQSVVV